MNLRNINFVIATTALLVFSSCKNETSTDPATNQSQTEATQNTNTTAALNPAHGEPGHRCEIPVGAPLDGSTSVNNTQQQLLQQQQSQNQASPVNSNTSPVRLNSSSGTVMKNPPHGQPGHDCAVPVGADLTQS